LPGTLVYYEKSQLPAVKSFITLAPARRWTSLAGLCSWWGSPPADDD